MLHFCFNLFGSVRFISVNYITFSSIRNFFDDPHRHRFFRLKRFRCVKQSKKFSQSKQRFFVRKTLRRKQSSEFFFQVEMTFSRSKFFSVELVGCPRWNTIKLFLLNRNSSWSENSAVEHSRAVFSQSKLFSVEKTPQSNSVEAFFFGRTWSKCSSSVKTNTS